MNLKSYLADRHVHFDSIRHHPTYTAHQLAKELHVSDDLVAKTVVLNADGRLVIAVVPASNCVDLNQARNVLGARSVKLALERELAERFPDCELGAVPPFGSEYGLETLVEEDLTHDRLIAFEGNSHDEAICMSYDDLDQIEHPQVAHFFRPRHPLY